MDVENGNHLGSACELIIFAAVWTAEPIDNPDPLCIYFKRIVAAAAVLLFEAAGV